jgi:hypothetical protein
VAGSFGGIAIERLIAERGPRTMLASRGLVESVLEVALVALFAFVLAWAAATVGAHLVQQARGGWSAR